MNIICPTSIQCPGSDSPILNVSSEAPDHFYWWNYIYPLNTCVNRLNCNPDTYYAKDCFGVMYSATSQADADLQANSASVQCDTGDGVNTCVNEAQTATAYCADGTPVTYTTPAGMFSAPLTGNYQACLDSANAQALSYAQQQASALAQLECTGSSCVIRTRSPLPNGFIQTHYSKAIDGAVTGGIEAFTVISGSLPPGLTLTSSGLISGTPTVAGTYQFTVKLLNPTQSIFCTKAFSLTIGGVSPTSYWKLDQSTLDAQQIDSLGVSNFKTRAGVAGPGVPAKFGNGVQINAAVNSGGQGGYDNGAAAYDYTVGQSFSFWGWFKILGVGFVPGFYGPYLSFYCFGAQQLMIELANSNTPGNVHIYDPKGSNDSYRSVSLNQWHFFHVFYDAVTSRTGYSIDNGAEVVSTNPSFWQTHANNGFIMDSSALGGGASSVIFDEIGVTMNSKLTAEQVAFLYNGGIGRTYPF